MRWLLPVGIVLVVSVLLAAVHFVFTRWLVRESDPNRADRPDDSAR
jgi:hypothetical protein